MLELIWGILNIVILIYFIIICFQATKIIRENLGGMATLILVLGLLSFIGSKPNNENNTFQTFDLQNGNKINANHKFNGNTFSTDKLLEENVTTKIGLSILFKENNLEKELVAATIHRDGFISGTEWKANHINMTRLDRMNYEYQLSGTLDWKILGIKIYTEIKEFNGKIELKK
jgi:hypothetical protein